MVSQRYPKMPINDLGASASDDPVEATKGRLHPGQPVYDPLASLDRLV